MSVLIYRDPEIAGNCAAMLLASQILTEPKCAVGVDYHESLIPIFEDLTLMTERGLLNWGEARVYQLFEFLPSDQAGQRIANLLGNALFSKTDISEEQYTVPFSMELAPEKTAEAFEQSILNVGGLDVALIAVRQDGSLLMNPNADHALGTHVETIDGDGFITAGIVTLMQAKRLIIVAIGRENAEAARAMLQGDLTGSPLAALRLHSNATFILDEAAAELL